MNNEDQDIKKPPKLYKKSQDAIKLVMAGIDPKEALKMVNFKTSISSQAVHELKQKVKKHSLNTENMGHLAFRQVKRILKGSARPADKFKVVDGVPVLVARDMIHPTDSNILAAASLVYDRYEPVKAIEGQGTTINHIDLSSYRINVNANVGPNVNDVIDLDPGPGG